MKFAPGFILFMMALSAFGQGLVLVKPMPPGEVTMELQAGLSAAEVAQDVRQHRLTRAPSAAELQAMKQAGAPVELLALVESTALVSLAAPRARPPAAQETPPPVRYWIFGLAEKPGPTGVLVRCKNITPTDASSTLPRAGDDFVFFAEPPPGTPTEDGHTLVNCEAEIVGKVPMRSHTGAEVQIASLRMINDLTTKPIPTAATRPPRQLRATIAQAGWVALDAAGGPHAEMKLLGIDFDSIRIRFREWPATKVVPIERGQDAKTLIYDDGHGCTVYYVDSISRPDNAGVFEFDHTPTSASYPTAR